MLYYEFLDQRLYTLGSSFYFSEIQVIPVWIKLKRCVKRKTVWQFSNPSQVGFLNSLVVFFLFFAHEDRFSLPPPPFFLLLIKIISFASYILTTIIIFFTSYNNHFSSFIPTTITILLQLTIVIFHLSSLQQ